MSTALKQIKKLEKKKEKDRLMKLSQRAKTSNPPTYNFKEGDFLALQQTVKQLVSANNNHHQIIKDYDTDVKQKVMQTHYMCQVILKVLVDRELTTIEDIERLTREVQSRENGYSSKGPDAKGDKGDLLLISFILYNLAGDVVDDRSKDILAYNLGSGGLPCDDQLIGISKGEIRHLTVTFGEGFTHKHLIGQELMLRLTCHDVQTKA